VFAPDAPPPDYGARTGVAMLLRPREFIANAQDLAGLKEFVRAQAPRYGEIKMPVALIAGDKDHVVSTEIHARAIARQLPDATLIVLPGVGHMVNHVAADRVVQAVDDVAAKAR
jgi:pimeloyl-ACP methyl ester carboxylesterase